MSELNQVLILRICEFDSYKSVFLATNNRRQKIYCDFMVEFIYSWVTDDNNFFPLTAAFFTLRGTRDFFFTFSDHKIFNFNTKT